jgi:hypothetical protein
VELNPPLTKYWATSLLVLAAVGCQGDPSHPPRPSALLQDGNHDNGNAFFFWLPPLVNQQQPAGQQFSSQLTPIVRISSLCTGAPIRTFAGSEVQIGGNAYGAAWRTSEYSLDHNCTYRIAAAAGTRELGTIDVAPVPGGHFRNVTTGEEIALLDDATMPIQFFIGVGSQCARPDSDCGEGVALPHASTTIVTRQGRAGVFVPAGAVDKPVTIIIESADQRPCILGLLEPVFAGSIGPLRNSCYDFTTEPPLAEVNAAAKFNTKVTVGICADVDLLDHVTRDLLQIFQLHLGQILSLNNVRAPFLSCDTRYAGARGRARFGLANFADHLKALIGPRPLFADTRTALDVGAGGETWLFSRFTWALPSQLDFDFDKTLDLTAILPGAILNTLYSRSGVTFSRTRIWTLLCPGNRVYANDYGLLGLGILGFRSGQNNISVCPLGLRSDFNENTFGAIKATFAVPAVQACISVTPTGYRSIFPIPGGVAFLEALDANGNVVTRTESTTQRVQQRLCVSASRIVAVRFAGRGSANAIFDNLRWTRAVPAAQ